MGFFKKKASISDMASALVQFLDLQSETRESIKDLAETTEISEDVIIMNYLPMMLFTIDYGTAFSLGNTPIKYKLLDLIYDNFFKTLEPAYINVIKQAIFGYTEALKTPHEMGPPWTIGRKFCEYCYLYSDKPEEERTDLDISFIMFASIHFTGTLQAVVGLLKQFRIKE
jgi:hypothetical protein